MIRVAVFALLIWCVSSNFIQKVELETKTKAAAAGIASDEGTTTTTTTDIVVVGTRLSLTFDELRKRRSRYWLRVDTYPFHGSSSLQNLLRSSLTTTDLCQMNTWQCEPNKALINNKTLEIVSKMPHLSTSLQIDSSVITTTAAQLPIKRMFELYGQYWNLSQPIFLCKFCEHNRFKSQRFIEKDMLPLSYLNHIPDPVDRLISVVIILWRPICLIEISSNGRKQIEQEGSVTIIRNEMFRSEETIENMHYYTHQKLLHTVISFGDLIYRPKLVRDKLMNFLPILGEMTDDFEYYDKQDAGHNLKIQFASSHQPEDYFYDPHHAICDYHNNPLFNELPKRELQSLKNMSTILRASSLYTKNRVGPQ